MTLHSSGTFCQQSRFCAHLSASFSLSNLRQPSTRTANSAPAQAKIRLLLSPEEFLLDITVCGQKSCRQPTINQSVGPDVVRSSQTQKEECTRDHESFFCSPAFKVHQFDVLFLFLRRSFAPNRSAASGEVRHRRWKIIQPILGAVGANRADWNLYLAL